MFTGLVWRAVPVTSLEKSPSEGFLLSLKISDKRSQAWSIGDSIAINGVCLTVVKNVGVEGAQLVSFEVSPETISRTSLTNSSEGTFVHVEPATAVGERLGGHIVSGHVDTTGEIFKIDTVGDYISYDFVIKGEAQKRVAPFLVEKGSVAIDGVSLTVNSVKDSGSETFFNVMLIPHTLELTRFGSLSEGDIVNLEADMVAKYVNRYAEWNKNHDR